MHDPQMYRLRQSFDGTRVERISETVQAELSRLSLSGVGPGHRVAITAGSRGICHIARILRAIADFFRSLGAEPFIFPGTQGKGTVAAVEKNDGQTAF